MSMYMDILSPSKEQWQQDQSIASKSLMPQLDTLVQTQSIEAEGAPLSEIHLQFHLRLSSEYRPQYYITITIVAYSIGLLLSGDKWLLVSVSATMTSMRAVSNVYEKVASHVLTNGKGQSFPLPLSYRRSWYSFRGLLPGLEVTTHNSQQLNVLLP